MKDALVLAGGGSRGSYEAGVCLYAAEHTDYKFAIQRGTSTGAINIGGMAQYPSTKFLDAAKYAVSMWREKVTGTKDIWQLKFPAGLPILWSESMGKNDQLWELLTPLIDPEKIRASDVDAAVAAVDVLSGRLEYFPLGDQDTLRVIMASASFPMAFPAVEYEGGWYTDGGVREIAPLSSAISAGADRVLVVTTTDPNMIEPVTREQVKTGAAFGMRILRLMSHEVLHNDVKMCQVYNRLIAAGLEPRKRAVLVEVVSPSEPLGDPLDFDGDMMKRQIDLGYSDAEATLGTR
jgi:NTE family protein